MYKLPSQVQDSSIDDYSKILNLVVIGHVDSGKSTLMGHLLFNVGCVTTQ